MDSLSGVGFVFALMLQIPGRGYAGAKRDSGWRIMRMKSACRVSIDGVASDKEQRSSLDWRDSSDEVRGAEFSE